MAKRKCGAILIALDKKHNTWGLSQLPFTSSGLFAWRGSRKWPFRCGDSAGFTHKSTTNRWIANVNLERTPCGGLNVTECFCEFYMAVNYSATLDKSDPTGPTVDPAEPCRVQDTSRTPARCLYDCMFSMIDEIPWIKTGPQEWFVGTIQ